MTTQYKNYLIDLQAAKNSAESSNTLKLFYNETAHFVFAYCQKKGLSPETSEDIVQIVFTKIFTNKDKYKAEHRPLAWLYIITKSETKDYLKSQNTYKNYVTEFSIFMSQMTDPNPSTNQDVNMSILSAKEQHVLNLRYTEDKDFDDIASSLKTSALNIRKIISRSLVKLRKGET